MSKIAHLAVLGVALFGFSTSTAVQVNLTVAAKIPTPIIGDALFEEITVVPIIGDALFEDRSNSNATRSLQAAYPPNGFQTEMLKAVNKERQAHGLSDLCMNKKLENAAQGHSNDMATNDYMAHTSPSGSTMSQRIRDSGYVRSSCGENVAAGHTSVQQVMEAWMNSPHHRDNILRKKFMHAGFGYAYLEGTTYQHYWTQNFGSSKSERCS